jgi:hypothetical protein
LRPRRARGGARSRLGTPNCSLGCWRRARGGHKGTPINKFKTRANQDIRCVLRFVHRAVVGGVAI